MDIYVLRIALRGAKPPIWRRLAAPATVTLGQLHHIIQLAMGWMNCHMHHFRQRKATRGATTEQIAELFHRGSLDELEKTLSPERIFEPKDLPFEDPFPTVGEDENAVTLQEVCPKVKDKLIYEYDFGDGWEHDVIVQKIEPAKPDKKYPICLAGKRACPPEDCGGIYGYAHLLEVISDPEHPDHAEMADWVSDDFDPEAIDIGEINERLARL